MLELFVCVVRTYKLNNSHGNDIAAILMMLCLIYYKIKSRLIHLMKSFLYISDIHEYHVMCMGSWLYPCLMFWDILCHARVQLLKMCSLPACNSLQGNLAKYSHLFYPACQHNNFSLQVCYPVRKSMDRRIFSATAEKHMWQ